MCKISMFTPKIYTTLYVSYTTNKTESRDGQSGRPGLCTGTWRAGWHVPHRVLRMGSQGRDHAWDRRLGLFALRWWWQIGEWEAGGGCWGRGEEVHMEGENGSVGLWPCMCQHPATVASQAHNTLCWWVVSEISFQLFWESCPVFPTTVYKWTLLS